MKVKMLYFAQVAEKLGITSEIIELDENHTTTDLIKTLELRYPELTKLTYKLAVDQVLIQDEKILSEGYEIALLPPFAGG